MGKNLRKNVPVMLKQLRDFPNVDFEYQLI